ncbi:NopRA1 domain-containing protein [Aphelenchoides fujianensis]|nr:NopRA1 domain-containing protein [Aphelenchoides fujianensis]
MPKPLGCESFLALRKPNQILECLDAAVVLQTANRMVRAEYRKEPLDDEHYEPRELLGMFYSLIFRGSELSCKRFVDANGLYFLLLALSLDDEELRAIAYVCLQRYTLLAKELNIEDFAAKPLITYFLQLVKNGMERPNQRLPSPVTRFLAESVNVMQTPAYAMFRPLMSSFVQRPALQLDCVSEFQKFFFSESLANHDRERHWILGCVCASINRPEDYEVLDRSGIVASCLAAFTTDFCNNTTKMRVVILLRNCLQHPTCARNLVDKHSLNNWLVYAVNHRTTTSVEVGCLAEIFAQLVRQTAEWIAKEAVRLRIFRSNYQELRTAVKAKCPQTEVNPLKGVKKRLFPTKDE